MRARPKSAVSSRRSSLRTARILRGGFTGGQTDRIAAPHRRPARMVRPGQASAARDARLPTSESADGKRHCRQSGARKRGQWLDRIRAPKPLRDTAMACAGSSSRTPTELSLLALTDQFADEGVPGAEKMFRIVGGNDRLPALIAKGLGSGVKLKAVLRRVTQARDGVTVID